jgi:hypothetical protein
MPDHHVRPDGMPPTNGYSDVVSFTGRMMGATLNDVVKLRVLFTTMSDLADFRTVRNEIEALAALSG